MTETVYSAERTLSHPARFVAAAREDMRRTPAIAWRLFRRNLQARYRRTWLAYAWLLLPTVVTTLVWSYIHSQRIIVISPTDLPYPLHVLASMALWQTFLEAMNAPLQQLTASRQMVTRSPVPLEALVLAGVLEVLLNSSVRLVLLGVVLLASGVPLGESLLLVPFGIAALVMLGLAFGVLLTPLGLLYDDVGRAIVMVSGFWFFLTPVVYRAPTEGLLRLNPVTPLLEMTRTWLTSAEPASLGFLVVSGTALALLAIGWLLLRLARPHLVERLG